MYYCERNQIAKNENKARMMQALPILSYFHEVPTPLQSLPLSTTACHIESKENPRILACACFHQKPVIKSQLSKASYQKPVIKSKFLLSVHAQNLALLPDPPSHFCVPVESQNCLKGECVLLVCGYKFITWLVQQ